MYIFHTFIFDHLCLNFILSQVQVSIELLLLFLQLFSLFRCQLIAIIFLKVSLQGFLLELQVTFIVVLFLFIIFNEIIYAFLIVGMILFASLPENDLIVIIYLLVIFLVLRSYVQYWCFYLLMILGKVMSWIHVVYFRSEFINLFLLFEVLFVDDLLLNLVVWRKNHGGSRNIHVFSNRISK